jgi:ABC-type transporter Mla MlaB component
MSTKKVKRKRTAAHVAAVVEVAAPAAPSHETLVLTANCNVKGAAELKQVLCLHVDAPAPIALDVGGVERIDTSTMQLLCAFALERAAHQRRIEWLGDDRIIRDAARLLGVEALLGLPPVSGAAA